MPEISDRVLPATSTWKLKINALPEGQQEKTPNIPTSRVRYWNYSAVVVPHSGHSSTDSLHFQWFLVGIEHDQILMRCSGWLRWSPTPMAKPRPEPKATAGLGLSMARKSTPHFSQFSEFNEEMYARKMWSYTRKLPLSGRVNSCSAPKCFLNVQLVFPTLNLCTCQSLQLIYISHIIYIYRCAWYLFVCYLTERSIHTMLFLRQGFSPFALLRNEGNKVFAVIKGSCFWNENMPSKTCHVYICIYVYCMYIYVIDIKWYRNMSDLAVKFRPFVPDKFACQVLKLE